MRLLILKHVQLQAAVGRPGSCGACAAPLWLPAAPIVRWHGAGTAGTAASRQAINPVACGHRGVLGNTAGSGQRHEGAAYSTRHDSRAELAGGWHCSRPRRDFSAVCSAGSIFCRCVRLGERHKQGHSPKARQQCDRFKSKRATGCCQQVRHVALPASGAIPAGQSLRKIYTRMLLMQTATFSTRCCLGFGAGSASSSFAPRLRHDARRCRLHISHVQQGDTSVCGMHVWLLICCHTCPCSCSKDQALQRS
jgi:hypothetical protein